MWCSAQPMISTTGACGFITDLGLEVVARLKERVDAHHESIEEALGPRKTLQLKKLLESLITESRPN